MTDAFRFLHPDLHGDGVHWPYGQLHVSLLREMDGCDTPRYALERRRQLGLQGLVLRHQQGVLRAFL